MSHFVVDVESDGPLPGVHSMISFGIRKVDRELNISFLGKVKPISENRIEKAAAVSGVSREEHLTYDDPAEVMENAKEWIWSVNNKRRPIL